jgi:hypothetical protein
MNDSMISQQSAGTNELEGTGKVSPSILLSYFFLYSVHTIYTQYNSNLGYYFMYSDGLGLGLGFGLGLDTNSISGHNNRHT